MNDQTKRLFVTHYPPRISAEDLGNVFESIGPISECIIPFHKPYAFVEFLEPEDAQTAMDRLNGYGMGPHRLSIRWANPKSNTTRRITQNDKSSQNGTLEKPSQRYVMPPDYDNSNGSMEGGNSTSSFPSSIQHSPETVSSGWGSTKKMDESTQKGDFGSWGLVDMPHDRVAAQTVDPSQQFSEKPNTFPNRGTGRKWRQEDIRMLDDEDRSWMQNSKGSHCLSRKKHHLDSSDNQNDVSKSKRSHLEPGWD